MNINDALVVVQELLEGTGLNKTQEMVFTQIWQGLSYQEIAKQSGYNSGYVRSVGSKLLQMIAIELGEKVTKNNLKRSLKRYQQQGNHKGKIYSLVNQAPTNSHPISVQYAGLNLSVTSDLSKGLSCLSKEKKIPDWVPPKQDWGEAIDVTGFCGRATELEILTRWIVQDRCRLVGLIGTSGVGKTSLSVQLAQQLLGMGYWDGAPASLFEAVVWRSLRYPLPLSTFVAKIIQFLSDGQETPAMLPENTGDRISRLMDYLRNDRCLITLSQFHRILDHSDSGSMAQYRPGSVDLKTVSARNKGKG
jgi:hypothetical protein